jgi:RNA polymerase sigma-70 factor (ECF subfamily)
MVTRDQQIIGGALVAEYSALISYSRRLTSNGPEARDLVQMVCARVLSQRTEVSKVENVAAWLRTVLFRQFVDVRRREKWEIPVELAALEQSSEIEEADPSPLQVTVDDVRTMIPSLPAHYRVPYELFTFEEMPYSRIAEVLGLSCKTVGTRINRARRRLRNLLEAQRQV